MDLETVTQIEVSQKEENKYRILAHICGIQKNGINDLQSRNRDPDVEKKHMDTMGEGGSDELGDWD